MSLTFQFFSDAALTVPLAEDLHDLFTDGTGNPRTVQLWLGSTTAGKQLRAVSNPGVDQVALSIEQLVPPWSAGLAVAGGSKIRPSSTNNRVYQAGGAGTTHATTEPTWPTTLGATVADNDITWTCLAYEDTPNEIKLATTSGGLAGATPGAGLNLGATILSGAGSAAAFWMQRTDADLVDQDQTHLRLITNAVREDAV